MKLSRPTLLLGALSLAVTLFAPQPLLAQDSGITAREVLDRETSEGFRQVCEVVRGRDH